MFQDGLGKLQGYQATIQVDPDAQPRFCKARSVPYAMKEMVEKEPDRLVEAYQQVPLLIHFNPKFEIVLACDASSYGIGAVTCPPMVPRSPLKEIPLLLVWPSFHTPY